LKAAFQIRRALGESCSQHVGSVNRRFFRQDGNDEAPGKRVAQKSVQKQERGARTGAKITHARALYLGPSLFDEEIAPVRRHGRDLRNFT